MNIFCFLSRILIDILSRILIDFSVPSLRKMKKFYQVFNGSTLWNQYDQAAASPISEEKKRALIRILTENK